MIKIRFWKNEMKNTIFFLCVTFFVGHLSVLTALAFEEELLLEPEDMRIEKGDSPCQECGVAFSVVSSQHLSGGSSTPIHYSNATTMIPDNNQWDGINFTVSLLGDN